MTVRDALWYALAILGVIALFHHVWTVALGW